MARVSHPELLLPLLPMLARGEPSHVIARQVSLDEESVKSRLKGLYWLLGVGTRAEAVSQAYRRRLLDLDTGELTHKARSIMLRDTIQEVNHASMDLHSQ